MPESALNFTRYFADLPDPRIDRTKKHRLDDILAITLCAVICGADSFEEIERFGLARRDWLGTFLALPHGIPSHDTFNRVLAALDRKKFAACFGRWMAALGPATGLRPIAIDGKACRAAAGDTFSGCLHLVSAWATEDGLALGQEAVADGSHEVAAIPELLKVLDLKGALVTLDAAGCQTGIVKRIRAQGGDYLVAVKGNQPSLQRAVHAALDRAGESGFAGCPMAATVEDGHGRHEERYVTVIRDPEGLPGEWVDVRAVVVVGRERQVAGGENASTTHYYTRRGENWRDCPAGANRHNLHPGRKVRRHHGLRRCARSPSRTRTSRRSTTTGITTRTRTSSARWRCRG